MGLISVCMTTASVDCPMESRTESIYDLLRLCLVNQTYEGAFEVIVADAFVDRLPREFQADWGRAERVVLVKQVRHDRTAISGARNTAAAFARGDLIVFVDDCTELLPSFLEAAADLFGRNKIPTRVLLGADGPLPAGKRSTLELLRDATFSQIDPVWQHKGCPTDKTEWTLSGQAGGVFVVPTDLFLRLNGFDENFDGNWGCEDQEFWSRVDRLGFDRVGRADLAVVRWQHLPTPRRRELRRCREAYAQWAYASRRIAANRRMKDRELKELLRAPYCSETCVLCRSPDRKKQIESYQKIPADFDLRTLRATYSARPSGIYLDPWR